METVYIVTVKNKQFVFDDKTQAQSYAYSLKGKITQALFYKCN